MENCLIELWFIFDFMNKGYFGSLMGFYKCYVLLIEKDWDEKRIGQLQQLICLFFFWWMKWDEEVVFNFFEKLEEKEFILLLVEQVLFYEQFVKDIFDYMMLLIGMQ